MLTIHQYRAMLRINKHALDDALETHSMYQDEISECFSNANNAAYVAKEDLAMIEARLFVDLKEASVKVSNEWAASEVKKNREREAAWNKYSEAKREAAEWEGLLDAWKSRGYGIKTMADLYMAQYFALNSVSDSSQRTPGVEIDFVRKALRESSNAAASRRDRRSIPS